MLDEETEETVPLAKMAGDVLLSPRAVSTH